MKEAGVLFYRICSYCSVASAYMRLNSSVNRDEVVTVQSAAVPTAGRPLSSEGCTLKCVLAKFALPSQQV